MASMIPQDVTNAGSGKGSGEAGSGKGSSEAGSSKASGEVETLAELKANINVLLSAIARQSDEIEKLRNETKQETEQLRKSHKALSERVEELEDEAPDLYRPLGAFRRVAAYGILELVHELYFSRGVREFVQRLIEAAAPNQKTAIYKQLKLCSNAKVQHLPYEAFLAPFFQNPTDVFLDNILTAGEMKFFETCIEHGVELAPGMDIRSAMDRCFNRLRLSRNTACHFMTSGDEVTKKKMVEDVLERVEDRKLAAYEGVEEAMKLGCLTYETPEAKAWIESKRIHGFYESSV